MLYYLLSFVNENGVGKRQQVTINQCEVNKYCIGNILYILLKVYVI